MHERKLRLIVIHDGDLETKTIEISYRRLKLLGSLLAVLMVVFIVMASMFGFWKSSSQAIASDTLLM